MARSLLGLVLRADLVVVVCDPHVGSLRDALRLVRLLRCLDLPEGRRPLPRPPHFLG